jgi:UDP-2,3-diacylglucosamine pyrophosphatase LpxH
VRRQHGGCSQHHQGVAVRCAFGHLCGGNRTRGTCAVFYHHRLFQALRQALPDDPRGSVSWATCWKWHDQFDGFIRLHPFFYLLGDWAYEFSFKINKVYNWFRKIFGLEYWSLSQYLKSKVKNAITFINDFKILSLKKLDEVNCDSIMIGHIHTPAIEKIGDKTYYNTGDMVESFSYIIEDLDGEIKLVLIG